MLTTCRHLPYIRNVMNGRDLKLRRIALDVSTSALAECLGIPPSQISRWEGARQVTAKAAGRYLSALATFGTIPTIEIDREPIQVRPLYRADEPQEAA